MSTTPLIALNGLARRLVRDGALTEMAAQTAQQDAIKEKQHFVSHLVSNNYADSAIIAEAASDEFGTPLFDLSAFNKDVMPKELIDIKLVQKHHSLPLFKRGNRLFISVSDPTNLRALDEIKFHTGINIDLVLVDEGLLAKALQAFIAVSYTPLTLPTIYSVVISSVALSLKTLPS